MNIEIPLNSAEQKPKVLYHASSNKEIQTLQAMGERTRDPNESLSIFATPNRALASVFMVPTDDSWTHSGTVNSVPFILISDKQRFTDLDVGGAIYSFGSSGFENDPEKGLREKEWTSTQPVAVEGQENVESALQTMLSLGVQVYFVNQKTFGEFNDSDDNGEAVLNSLTPEPYPLNEV